MSVTVPDLPPIPTRFGLAFSGGGRWATCLHGSQDEITLERWDLARPVPVRLAVTAGPVDRRSGALPLNDGNVVIVRVRGDGVRAAPGRLALLSAPAAPAAGGEPDVRSWETPPMLGGYVLASPGPVQTVYLVTQHDARHSRIWRLAESRPHFVPVLRVPGSLSGGVWLDGGRMLALDHIREGHRADGIIADLRARSWRRAWSVSATSADRIVAYSARSDHLAVTSTASGTERLGLRFPGGGPVRFPEALNGPAHPKTPLTFDRSGRHLLVHEVRGASSRLLVYTPARDRAEPVAGPPGTLWPPASWRGDAVHLRFSAPHQPPTLATVHPASASGTPGSRWTLCPPAGGARTSWKGADLVELPGPAGPIEAVVYGGPGWRRCRHLVMALHGGPLSAWRFEFDPLLQHLAAAGIAVVAPNQRGSTGYGTAHLRPVIGDWGGPDLDDVVHLAGAITRARGGALPGPVLLGASYGAYLALLAAGTSPELWSGCAALAPFTSASSLYRGAGPAVRDRVAHLNGNAGNGGPARSAGLAGNEGNGELAENGGNAGNGGNAFGEPSTRDVLHLCARISAPLLLVHGTRDETVPVEQSRALRRRLLELGRTEGADFDYLEVDDDHIGVVQAWPEVLRKRVARFCLSAKRDLRPLPRWEGR